MSLAQQMRLTHETLDQRGEARLKQMRLTHEALDQREARLEQMSFTQQMRLTHEATHQALDQYVFSYVPIEKSSSKIKCRS